ncbi:MAG: chemotaxis protein CheW [Planctomycetota bacterium]|nr:chemotaxis protein CheW [Planctomycetota bacterium]
MITEDDELLKDFVIESQEHLAKVESQLLELESEDDAIDLAKVNNVFRAIHSIKGVAGFLNLKTLESLAHREEEVLNRLRNREVRPTSEVINTLLRASDCIKGLLDTIATSNEQDVSSHIHALECLLMNPTNLFLDRDGKELAVTKQTVENDNQSGTDAHLLPVSSLPNSTTFAEKGISPETLREYLIESHDNLQQIEESLTLIEHNPHDKNVLNAIFRMVHTIKGSAGFIGFVKIEAITHAVENLLSDISRGESQFDREVSNSLFGAIDLVRKHLEAIENLKCESDINSEDFITKVKSLQRTNVEHKSEKALPPSPAHTAVSPAPVAAIPEDTSVSLHPNDAIPKAANSIVAPLPRSAPAPNDSNSSNAASDSTIRVDVALLDKLMTRVGELVLSRNRIMQCSNALQDGELQSATNHLNLITTELQEGVMKTRMQPIGTVWNKFPRLVRDLASMCGKSVRITMEGKETELDKTIIEAIKDPLTHLVRNNVDHGIEKPEDRVANGKPAEGCLSLRAYHEGGQVNIEISDDGSGLNFDRIKAKALEKGLISPDQATRLNDHETAQLIFLPGFSTAEKVSNVSGRGVGMDVVKTNIEQIGGTVDLQSKTGHGTTVKIKIPLTLAIIPALIVANHGNRFAIPQVNLLELVRLNVSETSPKIEWIQGSPVYRLRGRLLPLAYLHKVLKAKQPSQAPSDCISIVVLRVDDHQFGLVVDQILDTEEIVVKPLATQLKGVNVYSGATIMGDGKVGLILDVLGLSVSSRVLSKDRSRSHFDAASRSQESSGLNQTLLVLGTGGNRRLAIPISQVARLEKVPTSTIEYTNNQEVVQYRGHILPLIRLANVLGIADDTVPIDDLLNVIVYIENGRNYGLVVSRVVDIVKTTDEVSEASQCEGLLGSMILQGYVTDLVDLPSIIGRTGMKPKNIVRSL